MERRAWIKTRSKWPLGRFQVCGLSAQPLELNQCSNSGGFKTSFLTSRELSDPNDNAAHVGKVMVCFFIPGFPLHGTSQ